MCNNLSNLLSLQLLDGNSFKCSCKCVCEREKDSDLLFKCFTLVFPGFYFTTPFRFYFLLILIVIDCVYSPVYPRVCDVWTPNVCFQFFVFSETGAVCLRSSDVGIKSKG